MNNHTIPDPSDALRASVFARATPDKMEGWRKARMTTQRKRRQFRMKKLDGATLLLAAVLLTSSWPISPVFSQPLSKTIGSDWASPLMIARSPNDPRFSEQTSLNQIKIPPAWDVTTGDSNLVVAIIDTGVNVEHEELQSRIWVNSDEIPNNGRDDDNNGYVDDYRGYNFMGNTAEITDQNGHGTGVASVIAANTDNGRGMAGINWNGKLMVLKALNSAGGGEYADVARALRYAADNGARVVNMSFGTYFDSTELQDAVNYALTRNVVIVAAAGNNNQTQLLYPAAYSNVIAVGAVDSSGQRASFSNYGNSLDVVAPGISVLMANYVGNNAYVYGSGTSFAAAHVTGIVSLILARNSMLSPAQVENIVKSSASGHSNTLEYGNGLVNAASALGSTQITDRITGRITSTSTQAVADNQTKIRVSVALTNNDFPLQGHQIRAYINGPLTYNGEIVDKREIYLGTTDIYGTISFEVMSAVAGKKLLIFSDSTAGVNLGDLALTFNPVGGSPTYSAVWVSQNRPGVLKPSESVTLWVELRNTGNVPWPGSGSAITGQMRLGTAHPRDRLSKFYNSDWLSSNRAATFPQAMVNPGEVGRFTFTAQAPVQPGAYKEYFNPVVEYVTWLPDLNIYWEIAVADEGIDPVAAHYDAEFIYKSANLVLAPGQAAMLQFEVKNTGTAKWAEMRKSQYGAVKLGTVSPYDRTSLFQSGWLGSNRATDVGLTINPGDRLSLAFTIKAPAQPGVYIENFRLVSEYITWFGSAIGWKITVQ